jgi:hypothetical protein
VDSQKIAFVCNIGSRKNRPEPLKILQERTWETLEHTDISHNILNRITEVQQLKEKIDK